MYPLTIRLAELTYSLVYVAEPDILSSVKHNAKNMIIVYCFVLDGIRDAPYFPAKLCNTLPGSYPYIVIFIHRNSKHIITWQTVICCVRNPCFPVKHSDSRLFKGDPNSTGLVKGN